MLYSERGRRMVLKLVLEVSKLITVNEKLKIYGENGENQSQMNSSVTKKCFKSQRPEVIKGFDCSKIMFTLPTNLRDVQLASFFRLYFCCLLDQDLKGQCR